MDKKLKDITANCISGLHQIEINKPNNTTISDIITLWANNLGKDGIEYRKDTSTLEIWYEKNKINIQITSRDGSNNIDFTIDEFINFIFNYASAKRK